MLLSNMEHSMKRIAPVIALIAVGCASSIKSQPFDTGTWKPTGESVEGIVYYAPQYMKITYEFSTRVDKEGKVLGTADGRSCVPVIQKEEVQIMPDYSRAYVLIHEPGFFTASKFSATLDRGMLTGVNTESATRVPELITAIGGLGEAVAVFGAEEACNAAPRIRALTRMVPQ